MPRLMTNDVQSATEFSKAQKSKMHGGREPLRQLNFAVPESLWLEIDAYCRRNAFRKVDVLKQAFEMHRDHHELV